MNRQLPSAIVMVRPARFGFNPETADTNAFQREDNALERNEIERRARAEFDIMARRLREAGVDTIIIEDTEEPRTPDAVFPNNWISFHDDGTVVVYPMFSPLRRPVLEPLPLPGGACRESAATSSSCKGVAT